MSEVTVEADSFDCCRCKGLCGEEREEVAWEVLSTLRRRYAASTRVEKEGRRGICFQGTVSFLYQSLKVINQRMIEKRP